MGSSGAANWTRWVSIWRITNEAWCDPRHLLPLPTRPRLGGFGRQPGAGRVADAEYVSAGPGPSVPVLTVLRRSRRRDHRVRGDRTGAAAPSLLHLARARQPP